MKRVKSDTVVWDLIFWFLKVMAAILSCHWYLTDDQLLFAYFTSNFPQKRPWCLCPLQPETHILLILTLSSRIRSVPELFPAISYVCHEKMWYYVNSPLSGFPILGGQRPSDQFNRKIERASVSAHPKLLLTWFVLSHSTFFCVPVNTPKTSLIIKLPLPI